MIEEAERAGTLRPGGTIVEPTSGNTGRRARDRSRAEGLPLHLRHAGQGLPGEDPSSARLRRRGRRLPDRRSARVAGELLLGLGPPDRGDRRAPTSRTSTRTRRTRRRTTRRRARSSGSRRAARSTRSSSPSAPAARSRARRATCASASPTSSSSAPIRAGSIYSSPERAPVPRRGDRRGLLAGDATTHRSSTSTSPSPTATRSRRRAGSRVRKGSSSAAPAARRCSRRSRWRSASTRARRS